MASGDPRDQQFGRPYTDTPVQQAARDGQRTTVLDMQRLVTTTIVQSATDDHYTSDGNLYHE